MTPGTVSKILWHFTGGPPWDAERNCQATTPKADSSAYQAVLSILSSRQLRVGAYKEVVKVLVPKVRKYNFTTKVVDETQNVMRELSSAAVCCVADIPVAHLPYHSQRYGRFALGFHRDSVLKGGFNPVFYTLHDTPVIQSFYEGFSELNYVDVDNVKSAADEISDETSDLQCDKGHDIEIDLSGKVLDIEMAADDIEAAVSATQNSIQTFLAFVKTFNSDEFASIYCEREWRSVKTFEFQYDDIAMIILPKKIASRRYFQEFVGTEVPSLKILRSVPIVPWEDLVEH
jgi:hypothetical protein